MTDDKDKPEEPQPESTEVVTSLKDAVGAFSELTTVPEAFKAGPVQGIAQPVTITVGTPDGARFVMIDGNLEFTREVIMFQDPYKLAGRTGNLYAITGGLAVRLLETHPDARRKLRSHQIYVCTYRHSNEIVIYPVKLPGDHPMSIDAHAEKMCWIKPCMEDWFRVAFNSETKQYDTTSTEVPDQPRANFKELYRGMSMDDLMFKGFRDHFIDDWDHAVLRAYRGA
jgi:hypothetical protein